MNIRVHIDRVVLDGLPIERHQTAQVQAAIASELTRLLTESGVTPGLLRGGTVSYALGGTIQYTNSDQPAHLGRQIGQAVYGGIGK
jgi:hypothetical protein